MILDIFKYFKSNFLQYFIITVCTIIAWHKILDQTLLGEGYYYFDPELSYLYKIQDRYDNFARLFFDIAIPILKDNIYAYLLTQLVVTILIGFSLYFVFEKILKNKTVALLISIIFIINHGGLFELMAMGNYQRYVQRVVNLIPMIFSMYYLFIYIQHKKASDYIKSIALYSLGIWMGHFLAIILPFFTLFPLLSISIDKITLKKVVTKILIGMSFVLITYLITINDPYSPKNLNTNIKFVESVLYQIPTINFPSELISYVSTLNPTLGGRPYINTLRVLLVPSLIMYLAGFVLVIRKYGKQHAIFYASIFFGMVGSMAAYAYVDERLNLFVDFGTSRYYLLPAMFTAILLGYLISSLPIKRNLLNLLSIIVLVCFLTYNINHIWKDTDSIQYKSEYMSNFIHSVKKHTDSFDSETVIIAPSYLMWPAHYLNRFYGNFDIEFSLPIAGWEEKYKNNKQNVFVFDKKPGVSTEIIDYTNEYRRGNKINIID